MISPVAGHRYTVVALHAHPDDESLLTAGTMAKSAAAGHRVVLVLATDGAAGLTSSEVRVSGSLGERRLAETAEAARQIGCARVVHLHYADSGMDGLACPGENAFAAADVEEAAHRLAKVLTEERTDVLTVYDPAGGYGHPDHKQVHRVGVRAAALAKTPVVLEATIDRTRLRFASHLLRMLRRLIPVLSADLEIPDLDAAYTSHRNLTHRIDVRRQARQKRAAMAAHTSQATADTGLRTLALLLRLPFPVFRLVCGHEWFVERGRPPGAALVADIFDSLERPATGCAR